MNIDELMKTAFSQILEEFEVRKSFFLNVVHSNIDLLAKNAKTWFGDDIPADFSNALTSLVKMSVVFYEQNRDCSWIMEQDNENFILSDVFREINDDIRSLITIGKMEVMSDSDASVFAPKRTFKESVVNIILCLSPYMSGETEMKVMTKTEMSSVKIDLKFAGLSNDIPDLSRLMKIVYSYYNGIQYNVRIGMEMPFASIKKMGGVINASQKNDNTELFVGISLPSYTFMKTVIDIRKNMIDVRNSKHDGLVVVSLSDGVLDMVIRENLAEYGYSVKSYSPDSVKFFTGDTSVKAFVVEESAYKGIIDFDDNENGSISPKIIVISRDNSGKSDTYPDASYVRLPFEMQHIVDLIECR